MKGQRIELEMTNLAKLISYPSEDIGQLAIAMKATPEGDDQFYLSGYETIGDAMLKGIFSEYLFARGKTSKAEITKTKQLIEANGIYHKVTLDTGIWKYAYNDEYFAKDNPPDHKKLPNSTHDPYIERIAAAIYFQSGFDELKKWVLNWLLPKIDIKSL